MDNDYNKEHIKAVCFCDHQDNKMLCLFCRTTYCTSDTVSTSYLPVVNDVLGRSQRSWIRYLRAIDTWSKHCTWKVH